MCIAFNNEPETFGLLVLCLFSFLTGCGSCLAFLAALKTGRFMPISFSISNILPAAVNHPSARGTATGLPLAGFGLSAFLVSSLADLTLHDDISKLLLMLALSTFSLTASSLFFIQLLPPAISNSAASVSGERGHDGPRRAKINDESQTLLTYEAQQGQEPNLDRNLSYNETLGSSEHSSASERSSLLSEPAGETGEELRSQASFSAAHEVDVHGLDLLKQSEYLELFMIFAILSGLGLMNIKYECLVGIVRVLLIVSSNIGNDVQALWFHHDKSADPSFVARQQSIHVSVLSVASCAGRLFSGAGSDLLLKKAAIERKWWLVFSSLMFVAAQICSLKVDDPRQLISLSVFTGFAYGILYGFFPSLLSDKFGVRGMSQNWGLTILGPVVSGNLFNLLYGYEYDRKSRILPGGKRLCELGKSCYQLPALLGLIAGLFAVTLCLFSLGRGNRNIKSLSGCICRPGIQG